MLSLALTLLCSAAPDLFHKEGVIELAFIPGKTALAPAAVTKAFEPFTKKKGRTLKVEAVKRDAYPGLGNDALEFTAAALSPDERGKLAKTKDAVSAVIMWPVAEAGALREVYDLILAVAQKNEAYVFDRNAASAFTAASWKSRRIDSSWAGPVPIGAKHMQVHMVAQESDLIMLDTGGMPRFGIDDFELLDVNRFSVNTAGDLVNLVAQRLIEGARPDASGRLIIRVADLKDAEMKKATLATTYENGKGVLVVKFVPADPAHGARDGALELSFPDVTGKDCGERLDAALKSLFGFSDAVLNFDHDDPKVKAAMARAKAALPAYEAKVKKGLPQGEMLLVKAPFKYDGGKKNEWMWVDVQAWNGKKLRGQLENEPELVTGITAGATVDVNLDDINDYMYQFPDGSFLGNEVGRAAYPKMFEELANGRARVKR